VWLEAPATNPFSRISFMVGMLVACLLVDSMVQNPTTVGLMETGTSLSEEAWDCSLLFTGRAALCKIPSWSRLGERGAEQDRGQVGGHPACHWLLEQHNCTAACLLLGGHHGASPESYLFGLSLCTTTLSSELGAESLSKPLCLQVVLRWSWFSLERRCFTLVPCVRGH